LQGFGIDIGGSGIKGAPVDLSTGLLAADRHKILTPQPSTLEAVEDVVAQLVAHFDWSGPVGITFPGVVQRGVVRTAANVDKGWVDADADTLFTARLGLPVHMVNDADAAGIAEMRYGVGRDRKGVVIMVTLGTGIGTAVFNDGVLVPNAELGHLEMGGKDAEKSAAARVRELEGLSWSKWAKRVEAYLRTLHSLMWPDLIVIGGGVSARAEKFLPLIEVPCEVVPAQLANTAGIVGAALLAADLHPASG
jgi:polyphosphate glucokinase